MPRKSDTREKVFAAADQLLQQGAKPTQQSIRDLIGTGSISTINAALNDWWASLADRVARKNEHPELPEPVLTAANQLWDQALAYAHHNLNQQRAELQQTLGDIKKQSNEELNNLRQLVDRLQDSNANLRSELDEAFRASKAEQVRASSLETQVIRLTSERDDLSRKVKQLERLFDKDQTNASKGGAKADSQHQEKMIELRVENKVLSNKINELNDLLSIKSTENEQLTRQLTSQEKEALQQQHRLELVLAQQDARYEDVVNSLNHCRLELAQVKDNN